MLWVRMRPNAAVTMTWQWQPLSVRQSQCKAEGLTSVHSCAKLKFGAAKNMSSLRRSKHLLILLIFIRLEMSGWLSIPRPFKNQPVPLWV